MDIKNVDKAFQITPYVTCSTTNNFRVYQVTAVESSFSILQFDPEGIMLIFYCSIWILQLSHIAAQAPDRRGTVS